MSHMEKQYGPLYSKKKVFISSKIEIENINTTKQEFTVVAKINLFWKDEICLDQERMSANEPEWRKFGPFAKDNIHNKWYRVPLDYLKKRDKEIDKLWNEYNKGGRQGDRPKRKFYVPLMGSASWGSLKQSFETAKPKTIQNFNEEEKFVLMAREIQGNEKHCYYCQYVEFRATFDQFFEMKYFPYDKQILNINFLYYSKKFEIVKYLPEEIRYDWLVQRWDMHKSLKCRFIDTMWTSEWSLIKAEFDQNLGSRKSTRSVESHLISIQLRVERRPMHYQLYSLFPVFLVTSCNFATFWLKSDDDPEKEFQNRLSLILTTLLTVTASQLSSVQGLPNLPTTTIIDKYIAGSFLLTVSFIPFTIVSNSMDDTDEKEQFEMICIVVLAALWCLLSIFYAGGAVRIEALERFCCVEVLHESWKERAKRENERRSLEGNNNIEWKEDHCDRGKQSLPPTGHQGKYTVLSWPASPFASPRKCLLLAEEVQQMPAVKR